MHLTKKLTDGDTQCVLNDGGKVYRRCLVYSLLLVLGMPLGLTGCARWITLPETQQSSIEAATHWRVRGKLSVRSPDEAVTGYLDWTQSGQAYDLYIGGPLGQGATRLKGDALFASIQLPGWEAPQLAPSAESLMLQHLGWNFPVTDIRYWVKGIPSTQHTFEAQYNELGLIEGLTQHGWSIRFSRYQRLKDAWFPGLIKIEGRDYRFTFAIKEWTLRPSEEN